jgi:hypothetical protein
MIVTAAMPMAQKAENSRRTMSENPERSLPNCSTESKGEKSSEILRRKIRGMKKFIQLLDSVENSAGNKAMIERLTYLEDSDLECTCHLSMKNIAE